MNTAEIVNFNEKAGFICDMDGVIYHGNQVLPGVKLYINTTNADGVDMVLPLESFVDAGEPATEPTTPPTEGGD